MSNLFVCIMGIGTVFSGLIALVFICYLISFVSGLVCKSVPAPSNEKIVKKSSNDDKETIVNKGEIVAAACAVIAQELGEDVKNIKVVSFKKA